MSFSTRQESQIDFLISEAAAISLGDATEVPCKRETLEVVVKMAGVVSDPAKVVKALVMGASPRDLMSMLTTACIVHWANELGTLRLPDPEPKRGEFN